MKNNNGLVSKAIAGDKAAFEELYNEYSDKVYFFALRNVGSEDAARDITSETFVNAFESIGTLQSEKSFSNWLFSIASEMMSLFNSGVMLGLSVEEVAKLTLSNTGILLSNLTKSNVFKQFWL